MEEYLNLRTDTRIYSSPPIMNFITNHCFVGSEGMIVRSGECSDWDMTSPSAQNIVNID